MSMGPSRRQVLAGAAAVTLTLAARAGRAADDALVAAAKKEGKVNFYSVVDQTITQSMVTAFKDKYGIDVDVTRLTSGPLAQRLEAEAGSGNTVGDVVITTDYIMVKTGVSKGWFGKIDGFAGLDAYPQRNRSSNYVVIGHVPYSLVWNKTEVTKDPTGWKDLLDPALKGRVLLVDPRIGGGSPQWYLLLRRTYGDDFVRQMGQGAQFVTSVVPGLQQIAADAKAIYAPAIHQVTVPLQAKGAPLGEIFPAPTISSDNIMLMMAKPPHPNAGRLLAEFCMTPEAQALLNKDGFSPLPNIPGTRPLPALGDVSPEEAAASIKETAGLLGLG